METKTCTTEHKALLLIPVDGTRNLLLLTRNLLLRDPESVVDTTRNLLLMKPGEPSRARLSGSESK